MIRRIAIEQYRSIRSMVLDLDPLTVVTGPNGSGKTNLYRALRLLAHTADNRAGAALAAEGGLASVLWAGKRSAAAPVALKLGFSDDDFSYAVDFGLHANGMGPFLTDPVVKAEAVWAGESLRPSTALVRRRGVFAEVRGDDGWEAVAAPLQQNDSILAQLADPRLSPEIVLLREQIRAWRFHETFRTDPDAPSRRPHAGTFSPVLADDGGNLPSVLATIRHQGLGHELDAAIDEAFPGSRLQLATEPGRFTAGLAQGTLERPLLAHELSDGTLRYLLLAAALLSPRPPRLLVLNEPEAALHVDLVPALASLIRRTSERTQVLVITHSADLARRLGEHGRRVELSGVGDTAIEGLLPLEHPPWTWPQR